MVSKPTLHIDNIKVFTKNIKHKGDYFLITEDDLTLWVKDPEGMLKAEDSNILSLDGEFGVETLPNGRKSQYISLVEVEFEGSYVENIPEGAAPYVSLEKYDVRPDYTGWSDEAIARDIMDRRKEKERREGNNFVKFRKAVADSQEKRHKELLKSIKYAKKHHSIPDFEDIEIDEDYMGVLRKEAGNLELKLGRDAMIGDGLGRLDGTPNYDANKDLAWGTPDKV